MRDKSVNPVSIICSDGRISSNDQHWDMNQVIGSEDAYYHFEKSLDDFLTFYTDVTYTKKIDIVVQCKGGASFPLEVKLTVIPDSSTVSDPENLWGPEMVIRPVTSAHAMMNVAHHVIKEEHQSIRNDIVSALKSGYESITDWNNTAEIINNSNQLSHSLEKALLCAEQIQNPFLIQPIWKTAGQSLTLSEQCFDIFVWSDVSVMMIPLELLKSSRIISKVSRSLREVARNVRALYDILTKEDYNYSLIYKEMTLGLQTSKSFQFLVVL